MFSVIPYMLRQTLNNRAPLLLFPSFSPLTLTFPNLSVILRPLYLKFAGRNWSKGVEVAVRGNSLFMPSLSGQHGGVCHQGQRPKTVEGTVAAV
jgi:hypothetical protein